MYTPLDIENKKFSKKMMNGYDVEEVDDFLDQLTVDYGKMYKEYDFTKKLLENIDIMVDGEFIEEEKMADLKFRGSINQKKIDVKASLREGKVVQLKFGDESRYEKAEETNNPKEIGRAHV